MQLWLEAMDFSKVHTLSIANGNTWPEGKGLLVNLPPVLTRLENLSIQGRWLNWRTHLAEWEAAPGPLPKNKWSSSPPPPARDFILAIPPSLKKLIWKESETGQEDIFNPILKHHGSTLQHLEWTNHERGFKPRPILTQDQLRSLGEWAPGLSSLTIDLERRNGTLPQEELKILAGALPKLRSLAVHLNLLDEGLLMNNTGYDDKKKHASDPVLDAEKGLDLFQGLRNAKVGEKLDSVEFLQGEWTNDWPFGQSLGEDRYWVSWDCIAQQDMTVTNMKDNLLIIIDSMCNLDLLFYAAAQTGEQRLADVAASHATTLLKTHLRPANVRSTVKHGYQGQLYSTCHVANIDPKTGDLKWRRTHQGYAHDSTWSRGQAWAILGYAQTYNWTKEEKFLDAACGCAEYFLHRLETSPSCVELPVRSGSGIRSTRQGRHMPL
ncbi:Unsaturated glucuronyl hydrolase [Fusarium bulbicola]|nr:Unsaturated glucuronyl hydrolase [Fusarium bulbicola]